MGIIYLMKIRSPEYLLIFFILVCTPLKSSAQVKIFASKVIEENSDLLVKGTGLKNLRACIWLYSSREEAKSCEDLYVRVNSNHSRAKIYLPSVDEDVETKLVVTSGPYASDEQEFQISIKDTSKDKEELMKKFQFFTKKPAQKAYSLAAKREDAVPFADDSEFVSKKRYHSPAVYSAQDLTFEERRKRLLRSTRKRKKERENRPGFRDLFRVRPRSKPPENPRLGDVFVSTSNALCIYMDAQWLKIVGSGQCVPDPVKPPVLPKPIPQPKKLIL